MAKPPAPPADTTITPELAEFLHSGLIVYLATCSADLTPASTIGAGLRVESPREITVFVARALEPPVAGNLTDGAELAVTMSHVTDHRSIQLKGRRLSDGPATEADRLFQQEYMSRLAPQMMAFGVPRSVMARLVWWPSRAIRMEVRDLYLQTPGANAGRRLEPGAASLLRSSR